MYLTVIRLFTVCGQEICNRHHHKMTAVYYSSREVWSLHSLSAFTSTSRFTDPDIEEVGEGVCFAHPSTLGLVWVRKKGVGVCPIIVNIGVTCMTYFFLVNSFADNNYYIYFMYKWMSLRLFPIFSESDTCMLVSSNSSILFLLRYRCV